MYRIYFRNPDYVTDQRSCCRSATGTNSDSLLFGPLDEVGHNKEVVAEIFFYDNLEFVIDSFFVVF